MTQLKVQLIMDSSELLQHKSLNEPHTVTKEYLMCNSVKPVFGTPLGQDGVCLRGYIDPLCKVCM